VSNESRETRAQLRTSSFYATVDGVRLHWTERGAGPGPPLLLLHGLADSQHTWSIVGSRLASGRRVLSLDLPGCGLSDRPDANYTIDWQARLVARWIDGIGIGTFDVLGHSFGGGVALWLLLYVAHSIRKLALIAPGGLGDEVAPLLRLAAVVGVWERGGQWLMGPLTGVLAHRYGHVLTRAERQALHSLNSSPGSARAFARTVRDVVSWRGQTRRLWSRIDEIRLLPSIGLFWGEQDRVVPIAHGEALCRRLQNCSLWRLRGAGHFLHWQAPEWLASAIVEYLDAPLIRCSRPQPGSWATASALGEL